MAIPCPQQCNTPTEHLHSEKGFPLSWERLRRNKSFHEASGNLLRTHLLSKKVWNPSPTSLFTPPCIVSKCLEHDWELGSHSSAIGDTISCDASYSAIGSRGKLLLRCPPSKACLWTAIDHFYGTKWGCSSDSLRYTGNTVRQGYCCTCLAIGGGISVLSLRWLRTGVFWTTSFSKPQFFFWVFAVLSKSFLEFSGPKDVLCRASSRSKVLSDFLGQKVPKHVMGAEFNAGPSYYPCPTAASPKVMCQDDTLLQAWCWFMGIWKLLTSESMGTTVSWIWAASFLISGG